MTNFANPALAVCRVVGASALAAALLAGCSKKDEEAEKMAQMQQQMEQMQAQLQQQQMQQQMQPQMQQQMPPQMQQQMPPQMQMQQPQMKSAGNGPEAAAVACVRAMASGNTPAFASCLLVDSADDADAQAKMSTMLSAIQIGLASKGGVRNVEVVDSSVNGNKAKVKIRTHYGNGESDDETMSMVNINGVWKILPTD